jgi:hypothetical protein
MQEDLQYPIDDMLSTARDLRSFIQSQWDQHHALFMANPDSFSSLLVAIARVLPNGRANELEQAINGYHKQFQDAYKALHDLAENIENAAKVLQVTESSVKDLFD